MINNKKLALIHIVRKELGLSDEEYRSILKRAAGVGSARELDDEKFQKLLNYFARSRHYRRDANGITLKQKLFIKSLSAQMNWSGGHLKNFAKKYYHKDGIGELTKKEAAGLIESLKSVKERRETGRG